MATDITADLYIIAAGKGTRMGNKLPKALIPFNGEPCLTHTLKNIGQHFRNVFVVINEDIQDVWDRYKSEISLSSHPFSMNVQFIPIKSGLGDGHATLMALEKAPAIATLSPEIVVCWGDVYFHQPEIITELLSMKMSSNGIVPALLEQNPYVTLLVDDTLNCMSADFSKYGEQHPSGFHDQSVFRLKYDVTVAALSRLHKAFWKNGRYATPGGELSLLYIFHYLYNLECPVTVYETSHSTKSFNTDTEVKLIREEILNDK